tara:strand:- start:26 stop:394 length:369 start_codon:yes stop_codon:yes gene_type:complete
MEKVFRFGLALLLLANGLNYFFGVIPMPEMSVKASLLMGAMERTGYVLEITAIIQLVGALFYLFNRYVTLSNLIVAPSVVNTVLFTLFLEPMGLVLSIPMIGALGYLFYSRRSQYRPLFQEN